MTFTKAELDLLQALADGQSADEIAKSRSAKTETVNGQIDALKTKLGAATRDEAVEKFTTITGWANRPADYSPVG